MRSYDRQKTPFLSTVKTRSYTQHQLLQESPKKLATDGWTGAEKPTDGPTDEWKDKRTDGRTDGPTNGQTNRRTNQTMDGSLHSCRVASSGLKAQLYTEGDYRLVYLWAH